MSQKWVLKTLNKLQQHKPLPGYKKIQDLIEHYNTESDSLKCSPETKTKSKYISKLKQRDA